jgi:hypothetical protein
MQKLAYIPGMSCIPSTFDLKNRKKLDPTSTALPAASAASIASDDVMPLLPLAAGQSFLSMIRMGLTSYQIGRVFTKSSSTTWLWFGVGRNRGNRGGLGIPGLTASSTDRSTDEACMVQVPGTRWLGSGHWVATVGLLIQASGI